LEHEISPWILFWMSVLTLVMLSILAILATRRLETVPSGRRQSFVELVVETLDNYVIGIIGPKGRKYTPFIGTLFIYILAMNLLGLVPGFKAPTSNLSITISLAVVVFLFYNVASIMEKGFVSWIRHLMGEPVWLAPIMFPIHVISELARPLSLSIRLYGNIFGEEMVVLILASLTYVVIPYFVAIPTQFPMMLFDIFIAFVQALIFSTLSAIYISIAVAEEHA